MRRTPQCTTERSGTRKPRPGSEEVDRKPGRGVLPGRGVQADVCTYARVDMYSMHARTYAHACERVDVHVCDMVRYTCNSNVCVSSTHALPNWMVARSHRGTRYLKIESFACCGHTCTRLLRLLLMLLLLLLLLILLLILILILLLILPIYQTTCHACLVECKSSEVVGCAEGQTW